MIAKEEKTPRQLYYYCEGYRCFHYWGREEKVSKKLCFICNTRYGRGEEVQTIGSNEKGWLQICLKCLEEVEFVDD